jgi:hypothetical protein
MSASTFERSFPRESKVLCVREVAFLNFSAERDLLAPPFALRAACFFARERECLARLCAARFIALFLFFVFFAI